MLLLDNHVISYIQDSLNKCHEKRVVIYYYVLNVFILLMFGILATVYLYYAFTRKPSPEEIYNRQVQDREYVLNQIQRYKNEQAKIESLSQLPLTEKKRGEEELAWRPSVY